MGGGIGEVYMMVGFAGSLIWDMLLTLTLSGSLSLTVTSPSFDFNANFYIF